jgi:hypothetical protein
VAQNQYLLVSDLGHVAVEDLAIAQQTMSIGKMIKGLIKSLVILARNTYTIYTATMYVLQTPIA